MEGGELVAGLRLLAQAAEAQLVSPSALAQQLEALAAQARRLASGATGPGGPAPGVVPAPDASPPLKKPRRGGAGGGEGGQGLDFSQYCMRYVALEVAYLGAAYQGFARQDGPNGTPNTVEAYLFTALTRSRLIPESAVADPLTALKFSRCGRTDKGVSALGNVVALMLRSNQRALVPTQAPATADGEVGPRAGDPQAASANDAPGPSTHSGLGAEGPASCSGAGVAAGAAAGAGASKDGEGVSTMSDSEEIDYPRVINRHLPPDIRVLGWAPMPLDFDARFSAHWREYRYFVVAGPGGGLDVGRMRAAAERFKGEHDFRNFCKADVGSVKSWVRTVLDCRVEPFPINAGGPFPCAPVWEGTEDQAPAAAVKGAIADAAIQAAVAAAVGAPEASASSGPGTDRAGAQGDGALAQHHRVQVYAIVVRGTAFLWHQVRCMAALLIMVGQGLEEPGIVSRLLDISRTPRKPQYTMAPEDPLLLYACGFKPQHAAALRFRCSETGMRENANQLSSFLGRSLVAAAVAASMHDRLLADWGHTAGAGSRQGLTVVKSNGAVRKAAPHVPLLKRATEPSLEEKMQKVDRRQQRLRERTGLAPAGAEAGEEQERGCGQGQGNRELDDGGE